MDTTRFILLLALGLVGMMLVQEWEKDYANPTNAEIQQVAVPTEMDGGQDIPDVSLFEEETIGSSDIPTPAAETKNATTVSVVTDVYDLEISLSGGSITKAKLLQYPKEHKNPDIPLTYFDQSSGLFYIMQGGLRGKTDLPTHNSGYTSQQEKYVLAENENVLEVILNWNNDFLSVEKIYRFQRDSYIVDISYRVQNQGTESIKVASYNQLRRNDPGREGRRLLYTYTGAVLSTPDKHYEKWSFSDLEDKDIDLTVKDGWIAMIQHYFVSALIPAEKGRSEKYYSISLSEKNRYIVGAMTPAVAIGPGATETLMQKAYLGPKTQKRLEGLVPHLELVVDYGKLWFIAKPLFICLEWFHKLTGNWGWAIILVTIVLKLIFYPLSAAGYRSMANMRRVQPRLVSIRERYKNDKQRLNQAMMELYKEEKINPLGGCFPILVQIPVFIALYWVLLESVEMRQAPFMLWLQDLSSPDPLFILPLVMGITMYIQQKLNPPPMDPVQQKVMSFLPVVFTVFFAFFPSGLVLYWVSNNVLSIIQQARINHTLEKAGLK